MRAPPRHQPLRVSHRKLNVYRHPIPHIQSLYVFNRVFGTEALIALISSTEYVSRVSLTCRYFRNHHSHKLATEYSFIHPISIPICILYSFVAPLLHPEMENIPKDRSWPSANTILGFQAMTELLLTRKLFKPLESSPVIA
jgi:hypothetical protein